MFFRSDFVHSPAEMLRNMKSVEGNELMSILEILLHGIDKWIPHVHGYALKLGKIALFLGLEPCFQRYCLSVVKNIDDRIGILVEYHGHIFMMFLERCFIDPYMLGYRLLSSS